MTKRTLVERSGVQRPAPRRRGAARQLMSACWFIVAVLLMASRASAAPKAAKAVAKQETPSQQAARSLLERGRDQLQRGLATDAMSSFSAAREVQDSLPVEAAIADASLALGKPVEARTGYAAALEKYRATLGPTELADAQAKLGELAAAASELDLQVTPSDAEIVLDGASVGQSPRPAHLVLDPGKHHLELKKPGFVPLSSDFELQPGQSALSFSLAPELAFGKLSVTTSGAPGVTELLIDGKVVGLLPWEGSLPVGKASLFARSDGATSAPVDVVIEPDAQKTVTLELVPNSGRLAVSSPFADTRILIDGVPVGVRSWSGALPVGRHRLVLTRAGFVNQEQDVAVSSDQKLTITVGAWTAVASGPPEQPARRDDHGVYVRLDLAGAISAPKNGVSLHCDSTSRNANCTTTGPLGALVGLRVGYRFGWIAPELFGMGLLDVSYVKANYDTPSSAQQNSFYGPARREDYSIFRYGWATGLAARATTMTRIVSATGSVGVGLFSMTGQYVRATSSSSQVSSPAGSVAVPSARTATSSSERTVAPGLLFDGGVLIGSNPGMKLYLGLLLTIEFAPDDSRVHRIDTTLGTDPTGRPYPYGTPALDIARGTQVHFGPVLGFQFGY